MRRLLVSVGSLLFVAAIALAVSSDGGEFTVTPNSQLVNWTNPTGMGAFAANLTITNSTTQNVNFTVWNTTSQIRNATGASVPFTVDPANTSWLDPGTKQVTLRFNIAGLAAGRYTGGINVTNATNATNVAIVNVTLDVPLNVNSNGFGNISGNVTGAGYDLHYVNMTAVSAYGLRVNMTGANALPINLTISDGSGTVLRTASFNASLTSNSSTQLDRTSPQTGYWLLNWTAGSTASFNASVELLEGSLLGNSAPGINNVYNLTNAGYNTTLTTLFWLNNSADYDVNITAIANSSSVSLSTDSTKNMSLSGLNVSILAGNYTLRANNGTLVAVNITVNTINTSDTAGNYTGWIAFTSNNGYPNATLNMTFTVNLTAALLVPSVTFVNESGGLDHHTGQPAEHKCDTAVAERHGHTKPDEQQLRCLGNSLEQQPAEQLGQEPQPNCQCGRVQRRHQSVHCQRHCA